LAAEPIKLPGVFMPHCPECEALIDVEDEEMEEGQTVDCPECGAELEVVNTNPLELNVLSDEEEEEEENW
jgi:alpha-aminoadipate/glutamate carrier protein LysW